jgi:cytochrome b
MKRILAWDIPTRLFHWLLAGAFLGAFIIGNVAEDEGSLFSVHMLLGATAGFMVLLRIIWGFVGSRYARFSSFALSPAKVLAYLKGTVSGGAQRYAGHNPGTSWTSIAIFVMVLGLVATGVLMGNGGGEAVEEIHEVLAFGTLAVVGVHVAGIIFHTIRHRENIAASMFHGRKQANDGDDIRSPRPVAAVVFLVLTGLWSGGLFSGYDAATSQVTLPLIGQTIQVGEGEEHGEHEEYEEHEEHEDDD